jgi:hypothetical protein
MTRANVQDNNVTCVYVKHISVKFFRLMITVLHLLGSSGASITLCVKGANNDAFCRQYFQV